MMRITFCYIRRKTVYDAELFLNWPELSDFRYILTILNKNYENKILLRIQEERLILFMGFMDVMKGVGKVAADTFLDEYASGAKKLGKPECVAAANNLKDLVDGKVDWNGNPIDDDDD